MPKFHETGMGTKFFTRQLPQLINAINRVADALEENNRILKNDDKHCAIEKPKS